MFKYLLLLLFIPSCAAQKLKIDLPTLVAQADRYQLPKPPADAKLILANTGSTTTTANRSSDLDPSIYEPGFLLKTFPDGSAKVMTGFQQSYSKPRRQHQPATLPFSPKLTKPKPGQYVFRGNSQITFATAIQYARMGDLKNAETLLQNFYQADYIRTEFNTQTGHLKPKNAHLLLALITYDHHYQLVRKKTTQLKQSLTILLKLQTEFPSLFPKDKKNYYGYQRTAFLDDLRLTVESPAPKPGSIEDLISQSAYLDVSPHMREPDHPIFKIYRQGTTAIPELVRLSTSRKLTPAVQHAIMNSREKRLRVGHLAAAILEDMTGTLAPGNPQNNFARFYSLDDRWESWLAQTKLTDEKTFFIKALGKLKEDQKHDIETPLSILLHKYPDSTEDLADRFSKSKKQGRFISTLMASDLEKPRKIRVLNKVSQNQKGLERRYTLQTLAKLDPQTAAKEVLPLIKALPKDVKEPYWTAPEANLTHVIVQLDDLATWKAYLAKTKTCAIGLRMEIMNPMNYSYIGKKNQNLRLAFLAAFLNDTNVRTVKPKDPRWEGPHAGFTHDTLSVQDFVAEKIATILKIQGEPGDHWTEKEWTPYRKQVELALSKLTLPDLS